MRNDYSNHTPAKLNELVDYFAGGYASAARDRSEHGRYYRHVYRNCLHEVALELHARRDEAAVEPFTTEEVLAEEALDAYIAGDPNA